MKDLTGQRFGKLIAIKPVGRDKHNQIQWLCVCDCGKEKVTIASRLIRGKCKACRDCQYTGPVTHGLCGTRIDKIYRGMLSRCNNPHRKAYPRYGGKGVRVCEEWSGPDGLKHFYEWSMQHGYADNLSIDRIDSEGNYSPENCRWATAEMQSNNTNRNLYVTIDGATHTLAEWCKILNLNYPRVYQRVYKLKWSYERALELV